AAVAAIAASPGVLAVHRDGRLELAAEYAGAKTQSQTLVRSFLDDGAKGVEGGRTGGKQKLGIIELQATPYNNLPQINHPAFQFRGTGGTLMTRFQGVWDCLNNAQTCVPSPAAPSTPDSIHGQIVAAQAASSIEDGQDPAFPGTATLDQKDRSGITENASLYYWRIDALCSVMKVALQDAVARGVYVVNMSFGSLGTPGSPTCSNNN